MAELAGARENERKGKVTLAPNPSLEYHEDFEDYADPDVNLNTKRHSRDTGYVSPRLLATPAAFRNWSAAEDRMELSAVEPSSSRQLGRGGGRTPVTDGHRPVLDG